MAPVTQAPWTFKSSFENIEFPLEVNEGFQ